MTRKMDANDLLGEGTLGHAMEDPRNEIPITDKPSTNGTGNGEHRHKEHLRLLSGAEFIRGFKPPAYLVDGILQRGFLYTLTGSTGHGKTAFALLLAELISSAESFPTLGKHEIEKGRVIYLAGENATDVRMRCIAASAYRQDFPARSAIAFVDKIFNINELFDELLALQASSLGAIDLVVVDTSSSYFLGTDEVNAAQMAAHARMLRLLTRLPGNPTVLTLAHPIKLVTIQQQLLPRGSGATLAEVDGNLTIWSIAEDLFELHWTGKLRGPSFEPITFRLETFRANTLVDARGRQISTVRAVQVSEKEEVETSRGLRVNEDQLLVAMLADSDRSVADLARACGWLNAKTSEPLKSKVHRLLESMASGRATLVTKERGRWRLTEKGKTAAREAAPAMERAKSAATDAKRFYSIGPAPAGSTCLQCGGGTGGGEPVLRIKDSQLPGSKAETLHEACAETWFLQPDLIR